MERCKVTMGNEVGLHARPAAQFVSKAASFKSDIRVHNLTKDGKWVSAKSILSVLTLGVEKGNEIEITAEGEDEVEAIGKIVELFNSDFK